MLRFIVLLLVLVNGTYYAWSQGLLRAYGWAPVEQSEPQRLKQQIRPETIRILSAEETRRVEVAAQTPVRPPECLQAGLLDDAQVETLRRVLETALPPGTWLMEPVFEPGRWIVHMGKYPNPTALAKKRNELIKLKLRLEPLLKPELEPGLSLGGFETQAEADKQLAEVLRRGVRTARVVLERAEVRGSMLRIPAADDAVRARLDELKPALADKPLKSCK
jgi:hypothetical protein